jgi:hypothetical protein
MRSPIDTSGPNSFWCHYQGSVFPCNVIVLNDIGNQLFCTSLASATFSGVRELTAIPEGGFDRIAPDVTSRKV